MDDILRMYGVESKIDNNQYYIEKAAQEGTIKEGQIYVASTTNNCYWVYSGIHTFEIVYSPSQNPEKPWVVYNKDTGDAEIQQYAKFYDIFDGATIQINKIKME